MTPKALILVVEDNALIYKRLKIVLQEHHYTVDVYTPSVQEAIGRINSARPDLALLDINLQGDHNGIYLGNLLKTEYQIPFIYVTEFDDDQTFNDALKTGHDDFVSKSDINLHEEDLVIQTKPHLDEKKLIRAIQNTLNRTTLQRSKIIKDSIIGLSGYLKSLKDMSHNDLVRVPVKYEDIIFFTTKSYTNKINNSIAVIANYVCFQTTKEDKHYFLKSSLKELQKTLPYNFVRINDGYIVNICQPHFEGRLNGPKILINKREFVVSNTYKNEVTKRLSHFYG